MFTNSNPFFSPNPVAMAISGRRLRLRLQHRPVLAILEIAMASQRSVAGSVLLGEYHVNI